MSRATRALAVPAGVILIAFHSLPGLSQTASPPQEAGNGLEITITANRTPSALQRTGSAITVISGEDIRKTNPGSLVDSLRAVPGLDITESGGPGATTSVRLRGANSGQTLVLIDGMRLNDPSSGSGEFDFSAIPPGLIDRIEVLRGPQSALYGSDAMGGVVNIITKRGRGPHQSFAQVEGGSYGTLAGNAGAYGARGPWSYSFALSGLHSDGFSRYGHRVARLRALAPFEKDAFDSLGGFGRIGYNPGTGFRFELGVISAFARSEYDASFGAFPDTPSVAITRTNSAFARAEFDTFDKRLTHALSLNASRTSRFYRDTGFTALSFPAPSYWGHSDFVGGRLGAEYQGTLRFDRYGTLIFGARTERETIDTYDQMLIPFLTAKTKTLGRKQDTHSAFALWQVPVGERLDLSFGTRLDHVANADTFATWRATAAYRITETGTKLRASLGTGGKAPTLYQRFGGYEGSVPLAAERSIGGDIGFDQDLFGGRGTLSVTGFHNRFRDLINFQMSPTCLPVPLQAFGCFVNVGRAETTGVEIEGRAELWPDHVTLKGAYTYLRAKDRTTGMTLARRPESVGRLALVVTPFARWTFEPSLTMVSRRYSGSNETQRLAPYARLDMRVNYRINETFDVYLRGENLNGARYSEVWDYGTTGRAIYAGMKATW